LLVTGALAIIASLILIHIQGLKAWKHDEASNLRIVRELKRHDKA